MLKFCDPKTKFILTGKKIYLEYEIYQSFYGFPEQSNYFDFAPTFADWCKKPLKDREENMILTILYG